MQEGVWVRFCLTEFKCATLDVVREGLSVHYCALCQTEVDYQLSSFSPPAKALPNQAIR